MNVDVAVVLVYLVATTLFGCSFYFRRGRDRADEFTKAGGRLPGWALALSVFATYVSSISFLALPAKAYLSNWNALVLSFSIPFAACAAAVWFVPFYRRQTSASAYSFLEARFGAWSRLYASGCFLVMQSVRSGMILYLLALVLNTLLGVDMPLVICVVGVATMLYSMMGGLHAVVWTDVVQSVVLIAGALLSLAVIAFTLPDGLCAGVSAAFDAGKLSLGDFSLRDWGSETFWVTFAYGVFLNLQNFGIDQTYTQRYVAAKSDREAVRSMFSGAMLYLPVSLVFVAIGTLLWAWVKSHPGVVPQEVLAKSDAVFPWFIIHRLPTGVSGLLVAAIIAAAMSTVSSTLNSGATVLLEDYAKRFSARAKGSEGAQVVFLRLATVGLGLFAVGVALAVMNVTSVLTTWWALQSVLSGGMLGLFLIGAFSRRTRSAQAAVATVVGVLAVAWVVFGARLLDLPQVLHVNLAMVVGTAALVLVGAFPVRRRVVALAAALLPLASSATIAVDVAKPPVKDQRGIRAGAGIGYSGSLGVDADARAEVVNAAGVVKGGFAVAGLGADRPLRYAIEFAADEGDGELALVVSSASAKDAAVKNVSVHRLATHHYFGKVSDTAALEKVHPRLKKAFDFLRRKDLDTLACGTYELEAGAPGEKAAVFAMVQELDLKPAAPGPQRVEAHGRYIDVQAPRSAAETFGVAELDPTRPDFPFDAGKDIGFIDLPCELKTVMPGEFAVFMPPRGAHAPCLSLDGPRRIRKVVVKVLAD